MIESHLSELLGRRRESIQDLARGAGLAYATVHAAYHHTSKQISFETMDKLCAYFDVQPGEIFTYVPDGSK